MEQPTIEGLAERLGRLESECHALKRLVRRWRRIGSLASLGLLVLLAGGARQDDRPRVIEAEQIRLQDGQGNRAILSASTLTLQATGRKHQVRLSPGAGLSLCDTGGNPRVILSLGEGGAPAVRLLRATGDVAVSLALSEEGTSSLELRHEGSLSGTTVGLDRHGSSLLLHGADGRSGLAFLSDASGYAVKLINDQGPTPILVVRPDARPELMPPR